MAKAPVARYGFIRESNTGKAERYRSTSTGQVVSRRQFDAARRLATLGESTSNEKLAKFNREINPEEAASRPARGKSSLRKLALTARHDIAAARIAQEKELADIAKREAEERKAQRKVEHAKRRKVKTKKINARLLKPGNYGTRVDFNDYDEYVELYEQAKATGKIFAYGLGIVGVNERTGQIVSPTVFTLRDFDGLLDEDTFYETMNDYAETKSYMIVLNYYMHLAFKKEFAQKHAVTSKQKTQPRKKRK